MSGLDIKFRQETKGSGRTWEQEKETQIRYLSFHFLMKYASEYDETFIWTSQGVLVTQHSELTKLILLTNVHINSVYDYFVELLSTFAEFAAYRSIRLSFTNLVGVVYFFRLSELDKTALRIITSRHRDIDEERSS